MRTVKFIFDLDGTVTSQETLQLIAEHFGVQEEISELTARTIRDNVPFIESFIKRVHILGKLSVSGISSLLEKVALYGERRSELVDDLSSAAKGLMTTGAERIIFACNTSYVFIPEVVKNIPELVGRIIHIIDSCAQEISKSTNWEVGIVLLSTEGTIETGIYDKTFRKYDIEINSPGREDYEELRYFIEAVKQNCIDDEVAGRFLSFTKKFREENVILGYTELPILYGECIKRDCEFSKKIYDPLQSAINVLVNLWNS